MKNPATLLLYIVTFCCSFANGQTTLVKHSLDEPPADAIWHIDFIAGQSTGDRISWQESENVFRYQYKSGQYSWTKSEKLVIDDNGLPTSINIRPIDHAA